MAINLYSDLKVYMHGVSGSLISIVLFLIVTADFLVSTKYYNFISVKAFHLLSYAFIIQVAVLSTAKQLLTHRLDEQSSGICKAETEHQDIAKNHHAAKLMIEVKKDRSSCGLTTVLCP